MRILFLSNIATVILDIVAWTLFHLISGFGVQVPGGSLDVGVYEFKYPHM